MKRTVALALLLVVALGGVTTVSSQASGGGGCRYTEKRYRVRKPNGEWTQLMKNRSRAKEMVLKFFRESKDFAFAVKKVEPEWTTERVPSLVRCMATKYGQDVEKALRVAECESGYDPKAYNATGCEGYGCGGVYQHHLRYWDDRAREYGWPGASVYYAYANVAVTMKMVRSGGWGPWECQ